MMISQRKLPILSLQLKWEWKHLEVHKIKIQSERRTKEHLNKFERFLDTLEDESAGRFSDASHIKKAKLDCK